MTELANNSLVRVLRTFLFLVIYGTVSLGQWRAVQGVWQLLLLGSVGVSLIDYLRDCTRLIHAVIVIIIMADVNTSKLFMLPFICGR